MIYAPCNYSTRLLKHIDMLVVFVFSVTIIDRLFVSFAPHLGTCFGLQHYVLINSFHAENHDLNW
jgi:hypothetical protein